MLQTVIGNEAVMPVAEFTPRSITERAKPWAAKSASSTAPITTRLFMSPFLCNLHPVAICKFPMTELESTRSACL